MPEWAKNQIADEPTDDDKRRPQTSRRNLDDDDDDRPRRGGFGRNRRGRGRDDDGGEETRPSKDVTLFDFFSSKPNGKRLCLRSYIDQFLLASTQKAPSSKTQKSDNRSGQEASASNQPRISSAMQVNLFSLRLTVLEVLFDPRNKYFRTKPVTKF